MDFANLDLGADADMGITLSGPQKAAVIVRLLATEGSTVPLASLSPTTQSRLTHNFHNIGKIDQQTVDQVVSEFETLLDNKNLDFPDNLLGALDILEDHLSPDVAMEMRLEAGLAPRNDPWTTLGGMEPEKLASLLTAEVPQIGAVILGQLPPATASKVIAALPTELGNNLTYTISQTNLVSPNTIARIGATVAHQNGAREQDSALDPVGRIAAILNAAGNVQREGLLEALEAIDAEFAARVRQILFTFADIPVRIAPADISKILRVVENDTVVTALVAANGICPDATTYILENISTRMADQIREEMNELGKVKNADGDDAMGSVTAAIRDLEEKGDLNFVDPNEDEED